MATSVTTSLRMSDELRGRFETLAQVSGRTRNALMIEAMEQYVERQLHEIALIQEGIDQMDAGHGVPHGDAVALLVERGMLSPTLLERDRAQRAGG